MSELPKQSDPVVIPPHTSWLLTWVKANFYATLLLTVAVCGALVGAGKYIANSEYQITQNQIDITRASTTIARHQLDLESIDRRINELTNRVSVLDERSRYAVERATQPNIPAPYQPGPGARR